MNEFAMAQKMKIKKLFSTEFQFPSLFSVWKTVYEKNYSPNEFFKTSSMLLNNDFPRTTSLRPIRLASRPPRLKIICPQSPRKIQLQLAEITSTLANFFSRAHATKKRRSQLSCAHPKRANNVKKKRVFSKPNQLLTRRP